MVLGLSGGVDSAVSAALLKKAGYEVHGAYMDITGEKARADAVATAEYLGIQLEILDVGPALEANVKSAFAQSYLRGETPNPCILCNPTVKFPSLLRLADTLGARYVATGHYAVSRDGCLFKGRPANDQSYMLCRLTEAILRRTIFPLGGQEKTATRAMAVGDGADALRQQLDQLVAGLVSLGVVDLLEVVDVEKQHAAGVHPAVFVLFHILQLGAVEKVGHGVVLAAVPQEVVLPHIVLHVLLQIHELPLLHLVGDLPIVAVDHRPKGVLVELFAGVILHEFDDALHLHQRILIGAAVLPAHGHLGGQGRDSQPAVDELAVHGLPPLAGYLPH